MRSKCNNTMGVRQSLTRLGYHSLTQITYSGTVHNDDGPNIHYILTTYVIHTLNTNNINTNGVNRVGKEVNHG